MKTYYNHRCTVLHLNTVLQQQQMDIQILYWCPGTQRVKTRYWDSQFGNSGNAENLSEALIEGIKTLDWRRMHQLSMDGPNVNWKILSILQTKREEEEFEELDDIGCCGLHAFQTGVKAAEWNLQKILHAMWKLLDKSPKRRGDFIKEGTVSTFPLKFCKTRWVGNEIVATRAVQIWGDFVKLIKDYQLLCQSKRPKNNMSYDTLVKAHTARVIRRAHLVS